MWGVEFAQIQSRYKFARIRRKILETFIINPLKSNSLEFARFRIRYGVPKIRLKKQERKHFDRTSKKLHAQLKLTKAQLRQAQEALNDEQDKLLVAERRE